jgi:hypothetical protein
MIVKEWADFHSKFGCKDTPALNLKLNLATKEISQILLGLVRMPLAVMKISNLA